MELTTLGDRSDHDFATSPFLCPATPAFPPLKPAVLGVDTDDLPANARLTALPDNLEFIPGQHDTCQCAGSKMSNNYDVKQITMI